MARHPRQANLAYFKTVSSKLNDQIGLTFWIVPPAHIDCADAYMEFSVENKSHRTATIAFSDAETNDKGYRGFTYDLTAIEMADPVTATFHYLDSDRERIVSKTYSLRDYIAAVETQEATAPGTHRPADLDLIRALANLGHYMQPFMSAANHWTVGTDYAVMDLYYPGLNDTERALDGLSTWKATSDIEGSGIKKITYSMKFGSLASMDILLYCKEGVDNLSATAFFGQQSHDAEKVSDGLYRIRISSIKPTQFGQNAEVRGVADGAFSASISPMAQLGTIRKDSQGDEDTLRALTAAYWYYRYALDAAE